MTSAPRRLPRWRAGCEGDRSARSRGVAWLGSVADARFCPHRRSSRARSEGPTRRGTRSPTPTTTRVGPLELSASPEQLRNLIAESGIVGRGGGEFPLARKLEAAASTAGEAIVVVNASEGEPASKKDMTLLRTRTHLVLDGAEVVAASLGASEIVIYIHAARDQLRHRIASAIAERKLRVRPVSFSIAEAPDRYVSGESSAVVAFLETGIVLPWRTALPAAVRRSRGSTDRREQRRNLCTRCLDRPPRSEVVPHRRDTGHSRIHARHHRRLGAGDRDGGGDSSPAHLRGALERGGRPRRSAHRPSCSAATRVPG